ncbi:hypothetical protein Pelo_3956 [Pelomyxa schiedti]|nr:hypothetical protein Pelo_3956 [Pelomyxa schiedti]
MSSSAEDRARQTTLDEQLARQLQAQEATGLGSVLSHPPPSTSSPSSSRLPRGGGGSGLGVPAASLSGSRVVDIPDDVEGTYVMMPGMSIGSGSDSGSGMGIGMSPSARAVPYSVGDQYPNLVEEGAVDAPPSSYVPEVLSAHADPVPMALEKHTFSIQVIAISTLLYWGYACLTRSKFWVFLPAFLFCPLAVFGAAKKNHWFLLTFVLYMGIDTVMEIGFLLVDFLDLHLLPTFAKVIDVIVIIFKCIATFYVYYYWKLVKQTLFLGPVSRLPSTASL